VYSSSFAQDTVKMAKAVEINDLQTLKSKGFLDMKADTLSANKINYKYKASRIALDTSVGSVKFILKMKFEKGYLLGNLEEKSTDLHASTTTTSTPIKIRMIACCTPYKGHPQHCCDPDEIKAYTAKYNCKDWSFTSASN
jgi:UDP-N-acetylenolpyruvoylglucosamine reductase